MSEMEISQVLAQMRSMRIDANAGPTDNALKIEGNTDFNNLLKESIAQVSDTQKHAANLSTQFVSEAGDVNLPEVMVAVQRASLSFEAMTQVRNKLLTAYQEVMNMQV